MVNVLTLSFRNCVHSESDPQVRRKKSADEWRNVHDLGIASHR
jgi:hypothetical protein